MRVSITDKKLLELFKNISSEFHISYEKLKMSYFKIIFKKKKPRKKTELKADERCMARKQDGDQCTRRRKHSEYCGKHNKNRPFGRVDNNNNCIKVKDIRIKDKDYLIDNDSCVFIKKENQMIECVGKLMENGELFLI